MKVQWVDHITRETKTLTDVVRIQETGFWTEMITRDESSIVVPESTDLFIFGKANA